MDTIQGPMGITDFDKEGMLLTDFHRMGSMNTLYNFPYYPRHMEAHGYEKEVDWVQVRIDITFDAFIFNLSHVMGKKGFLGSDYDYHRTDIGLQKRFWFSAFGYLDAIVKAGKVWNEVPYPLLILPNANLSYTIQPETYTNMNPLEFINDEYVSWDLTYYLNATC